MADDSTKNRDEGPKPHETVSEEGASSARSEDFVEKRVGRPGNPRPAPLWARAKRERRAGDVDPNLDSNLQQKRAESAKMLAILCIVSLIVELSEIPEGLVHTGFSLSVSAAWAYAALTMADAAELKVPWWQRVLTYALMATGTGVVIAGLVAKYLR